MLIQVKDSKTGIIYSNDVSDSNKFLIREIYIGNVFTIVKVENRNNKYKTSKIVIKPLGIDSRELTRIPIDDEREGEWVNE